MGPDVPGKPIRFGPNNEKGVRMTAEGRCEVVEVASVREDELLVHDEHRSDPSLAFALSRLAERPTGPTPLGVFRDVDRPAYGDGLENQLRLAADQQGPGDLARLLASGDTWTVD